jgi:hypothetical protein
MSGISGCPTRMGLVDKFYNINSYNLELGIRVALLHSRQRSYRLAPLSSERIVHFLAFRFV